MEQKVIITNVNEKSKEYIATALYRKEQLVEVYCEETENQNILGNVYVGRVKDVVKNINAAFIEISPNITCYYSLEDYKNPIFVEKLGKKKLVQGDMVVVQVIKESMKTKPAQVTTNISFTGRYIVLTTENTSVGISKKIDFTKRHSLKELFEPLKKDFYGIIVRTSAATVHEEDVVKEFYELEEQLIHLIETAKHRTCFLCLKKEPSSYIKRLMGYPMNRIEEIVTDGIEVYDELKEYLTLRQPLDIKKLRFYEDTSYSLNNLYSLSFKIKDALKEKVWLKSGAYIIIQPTEALTVIDVNSGKNICKKRPQEHYYEVNQEAAVEVAKQLRLRNISGIIIVDFIDMKRKNDRQNLVKLLVHETNLDPIPVQVLGMTKLNLVEITRKKVYKSLSEQIF